MTHNQFIKLFSDIKDNHNLINSFGNGEISEYLDSSDKKHGFILWVAHPKINIADRVKTFTYPVFIFDFINDDKSNEDEIISDAARIMDDLVAVFRDEDYSDDFIMERTVSVDSFSDTKESRTSGVSADLMFKVDFEGDACEVPLVSPVAIPGLSDVVTVLDQNGNVVRTLNPGETYTVEVLQAIIDTINSNTATVIDPIS